MNLFLLLQSSGGSLIVNLLPFLLIGVIFYLLVIRPNSKQRAELKAMIESLKNGDEVVTNGGVIGKIVETRDSSFIIRSAEKSLIEIGKSAVVGKRPEEEKK
ncbi:MAG: preprotein translocase subunit YajC [Pyrinomonadaceae bacterium]